MGYNIIQQDVITVINILTNITADLKRSFITNGYFPNSLILCSSFKEQTSSCPFFSATI